MQFYISKQKVEKERVKTEKKKKNHLTYLAPHWPCLSVHCRKEVEVPSPLRVLRQKEGGSPPGTLALWGGGTAVMPARAWGLPAQIPLPWPSAGTMATRCLLRELRQPPASQARGRETWARLRGRQ